MGRIQHIGKQIAWGLGYEVFGRKANRTLRSKLNNTLRELDINCVIDVGAWRGQFGKLVRSVGYTGRIVSFEPVAASFAQLQAATARDPLWECHRFAIGSEDGEREINVATLPGLSSFARPNGYCNHLFPENSVIDRTEVVPMRRLEPFLERYLDDPHTGRIYLKTDTQGHDLEVLSGAGNALQRTLAIQFEATITSLYEGVPEFSEYASFLSRAGFLAGGVYPIGFRRQAIVEADCVYVRNDWA